MGVLKTGHGDARPDAPICLWSRPGAFQTVLRVRLADGSEPAMDTSFAADRVLQRALGRFCIAPFVSYRMRQTPAAWVGLHMQRAAARHRGVFVQRVRNLECAARSHR